MIVKAIHAQNHLCPFDDFDDCRGSACMAWVFVDPPFQRKETDNIVTTEDGQRAGTFDPPKPDGDGWEKDGAEFTKGYHRSHKDGLPQARAQKWMRDVAPIRVKCGRVQGERDHWF